MAALRNEKNKYMLPIRMCHRLIFMKSVFKVYLHYPNSISIPSDNATLA